MGKDPEPNINNPIVTPMSLVLSILIGGSKDSPIEAENPIIIIMKEVIIQIGTQISKRETITTMLPTLLDLYANTVENLGILLKLVGRSRADQLNQQPIMYSQPNPILNPLNPWTQVHLIM